ncbi:MAG: UDP-N-acetylglucosamine 1-carboxyvinyltransferase, partial [Clostridia bacterium]|nr:UDP-N-acetylglucosamine 1-carboxyvinyltransferase [Clostridia bacterium]
MEKIVIEGGNPLRGEVEISGAKNAALAIIPAAILSQDVCVIENLPVSISDVNVMMKILNHLGAQVTLINKNSIRIDSRYVNSYVISHDMTKHLRASYYFIGALLGRYGRAKVAMPGGCYLGARPIDQHIKGFELLGANVSIEENAIVDAKSDGLTGAPVYLDVVSVGAT